MDQFWHTVARIHNPLQIHVWILDELVNRFLVCEDAILISLTVLEHSQVGLSRHQQSLFDNVDEAEAEEVDRGLKGASA